MLENESINEMLTRFTKIANGLSSLGDTIDNDQNIGRSLELPQSLESEGQKIKGAQ